MVRRFCYCPKCGEKIYNLKTLCVNLEPAQYETKYYCDECGHSGILTIEETYLEDTDRETAWRMDRINSVADCLNAIYTYYDYYWQNDGTTNNVSKDILKQYEEAKNYLHKLEQTLFEINCVMETIDYGEPYTNRYAIKFKDTIYPVDEGTYKMWSRWLNYANTK